MTEYEVDCEDPENADHPECQCDDDGDRQYDAWADERVIQFYERLEDRAELYKLLLSKKTEATQKRLNDEMLWEKMLIENLTGRRDWQLQTERKELMEKLLELWNDTGTHTNNVNKRDRLEKKLVENLTGSRKPWQNINSIHDDW